MANYRTAAGLRLIIDFVIEVMNWSPPGDSTPGGLAPLVWIDVQDEDLQSILEVTDRFDLDRRTVTDVINRTTLPLLEEYSESLCVVVHALGSTSDRGASGIELDAFVGERFLITAHDGSIDAIDEMKERMEADEIPHSSPAALLGSIALGVGRKYPPLIQELERQLDSLEESAILGDPQTAVEVAALRRDVIYLRRALGPQFDVYDDLVETIHPVVDEEARRVFARVASHHRRALESLEAGRALLGSVLETYRGAVAEQTNEIMRVLTVFSAIMLPLALIAGLWGMNFAEIPGETVENGFWVLVGIMVLLAIGVWVYFSRRGFIGAPRLRDLPKAVGLGLFTVGTAPIRVVTEGIRQIGGQRDGD